MPEIDGLSKETVLNSWMGKFDAIYFGEDENNIDGKRGRRNPTAAQSELILTKEQLYDMFQYILGIKRFEHQLLYQGCQVRNIFYCQRCCAYALILCIHFEKIAQIENQPKI